MEVPSKETLSANCGFAECPALAADPLAILEHSRSPECLDQTHPCALLQVGAVRVQGDALGLGFLEHLLCTQEVPSWPRWAEGGCCTPPPHPGLARDELTGVRQPLQGEGGLSPQPLHGPGPRDSLWLLCQVPRQPRSPTGRPQGATEAAGGGSCKRSW